MICAPLRGHTLSFHNSGRGWRIIPSACERRSLLLGISHGELSRREIRSENHTWPCQNGSTSTRRTLSRRTLSRTPGSRAIGEKVCRLSLGLGQLQGEVSNSPGLCPCLEQDVCSHIEMHRNVNCSQREEFALGPHKDLVRQCEITNFI